jgi:hypothetical protein
MKFKFRHKLWLLAASVVAMAIAAGAALALAGPAAAFHDVNERMIGGGWIDDPDILPAPSEMVTLKDGLLLQCDPAAGPSSLVVTRRGVTFTLRSLTAASCGGIGKPDTHTGSGSGSCGGRQATISWRMQDRSTGVYRDPKQSDSVELAVTGSAPGCSFSISSVLAGGNLKLLDDPNL